MDDKLLRIIQELRRSPSVPASDLSRILGVSTRTIRTYISQLNQLFHDAARIDMKRGEGYELSIRDNDAFNRIIKADADSIHALPDTSRGRIRFILNELLYRNGWVTLDRLADTLYVSRVTISNDLKAAEDYIGRFGLQIERKPRHGIRVIGPEFMHRLCLASLAMDAPFGDDLAEIAECVDQSLEQNEFHINAVAHQNLLVHIAVAIERIRNNCYVPMEQLQIKDIKTRREYAIAETIARKVAAQFDIGMPVEEVAYIAIHLAGKQTIDTDGKDDEGFEILGEAWGVAAQMIERVWESFRFDFREDFELCLNLARHIVPLSVRLKCHMNLDNPLLGDIKRRFPLAYSMASDSSSVLADKYRQKPSEEEIGYIALAFALALERQKNGQSKKNILIVCASGAGSAHLLEYQYRSAFGGMLGTIRTCDAGSLNAASLHNIDYVFTTVPIRQKLDIPVLHVSSFLDESEIGNVQHILNSGIQDDVIDSFFSEDLFFTHMHCESKEEVISELCQRIADVKPIPDAFESSVLRRESLAETSFGNRVAIPHPFEAVTDETFVCIGILDKPVSWNTHDVQVVFLLSISKKRDKNLQGFYQRAAKLLTSEHDIDTLISHQSLSTLMELLHGHCDL